MKLRLPWLLNKSPFKINLGELRTEFRGSPKETGEARAMYNRDPLKLTPGGAKLRGICETI